MEYGFDCIHLLSVLLFSTIVCVCIAHCVKYIETVEGKLGECDGTVNSAIVDVVEQLMSMVSL